MPDSPPLVDVHGKRITDRQVRQGLRVNIAAGALAQVWVIAAAGLPLIMFLESLGASNQILNYISLFGMLGMLAQLPGALVGERLNNRKIFWFACAFTHRLIWMIPAAVAFFFDAPPAYTVPLLLVVVAVSSVLAQLGTAPWWSWMADLVPAAIRGRFWGRRQAVLTTVMLGSVFFTGWALDFFKGSHNGFALLFFIGSVFGCLDIVVHLLVPEPKPLPVQRTTGLLKRLVAPLRIPDFRWLTLTFGLWNLAAGLVGGLATVYLKRYYHASFLELSLCSVTSALGMILSGMLGAYLVDRIGARVYVIAMMGVQVLSMTAWFFLYDTTVTLSAPFVGSWTVAQPVFLVILASFGTGMAAAGIGVGQTTLVGQHSPKEGRTLAIAVHWTLVGCLAIIGPWMGGVYADWIEALGPTWDWPAKHLPVSDTFGFMQVLPVLQAIVLFGAAIPAVLMIRGKGDELPIHTALKRMVYLNPMRFVGSIYNIYTLGTAIDREDRARAVRKLASLRTRIAASDLIRHLDDPSPDVREAATFALSKLGGSDAVDALIAKIDDPQSDLASHAIRALREIGDVRAVPALIRKIDDPDRETRTQAVRALGRLDDRRAVAPLIRLLRETSDAKTFVSIAEALARLRGRDALPDLLEHLRTTPDSVRKRSVAIAAGDLAGGERGRFYHGLAEEQENRGVVVGRWLKTCRRAAHAALLMETAVVAVDEAPPLPAPESLTGAFEEAYELGDGGRMAELLPKLAEACVSPAGRRRRDALLEERQRLFMDYLERLGTPAPGDVPPDEVELLLGLFLVTILASTDGGL